MSPNARGGGGLRCLSQWEHLCTWSPNKLWRSDSIFNLWPSSLSGDYRWWCNCFGYIVHLSPDDRSRWCWIVIGPICYKVQLMSATAAAKLSVKTQKNNILLEFLARYWDLECRFAKNTNLWGQKRILSILVVRPLAIGPRWTEWGILKLRIFCYCRFRGFLYVVSLISPEKKFIYGAYGNVITCTNFFFNLTKLANSFWSTIAISWWTATAPLV